MNANTAACEILHRLRPFLGSTNPKKQKKSGLPCVRTQDGRICATPVEAQDRWIEFFSTMEGGDRISPSHYRQRWLHSLQAFRQVDLVALPSLMYRAWPKLKLPSAELQSEKLSEKMACHRNFADIKPPTWPDSVTP